MGERYEAPSEADTRYWVSVLAVFPIMMAGLYVLVPHIGNATLVMVWGGLVLFMSILAALVGVVFSIPSRATRIAIILVGWSILLTYYGRQFVLLMRY